MMDITRSLTLISRVSPKRSSFVAAIKGRGVVEVGQSWSEVAFACQRLRFVPPAWDLQLGGSNELR